MSLAEVREALESQDIRRVKRFIDQGFDLNQLYHIKNDWEVTLLIEYCWQYICTKRQKNAILTLLSFQEHLDLNAKDTCLGKERFTALDFASYSGFIEIVHLLLQAGAETHWALRMARNSDVQKMLLAAGADPSKGSLTDITLSTKEAARKWLKSLQCAQAELSKIFDENQMLVQEVKDFIYTEEFLKQAINA